MMFQDMIRIYSLSLFLSALVFFSIRFVGADVAEIFGWGDLMSDRICGQPVLSKKKGREHEGM